MPGIVVGIDGSEHAQHVLEWAMREAALRQAPLTVLAVHEVASNQWTGTPMVTAADEPYEDKARTAAEQMVAAAAKRTGEAASVAVRAVSGLAAQELIAASMDADLIVVGSRGGGDSPGLGPVSTQVAHHACCPVVVIR